MQIIITSEFLSQIYLVDMKNLLAGETYTSNYKLINKAVLLLKCK